MLAVARQTAENAGMIPLAANGYFITGSDTDVGKTYVACEIVRQLRALGRSVATRKPAESGCEVAPDGELLPHDARALHDANDGREPLERIAAYCFRAALAPHRAARLEGRRLELAALIAASRDGADADCLLVEGAGGFLSPLAEDGLNADLGVALDLPVIAVVEDRVGAVNQALLLIEAIASRGLALAALVLNRVRAEHENGMDNAADLATHYAGPLFHCAHAAALPPLFEAPRDPV